MVDGLGLVLVDADTTGFPQAEKPRAGVTETGDQPNEAMVARVPAEA
jgi:hypothetical protein